MGRAISLSRSSFAQPQSKCLLLLLHSFPRGKKVDKKLGLHLYFLKVPKLNNWYIQNFNEINFGSTTNCFGDNKKLAILTLGESEPFPNKWPWSICTYVLDKLNSLFTVWKSKMNQGDQMSFWKNRPKTKPDRFLVRNYCSTLNCEKVAQKCGMCTSVVFKKNIPQKTRQIWSPWLSN
jgi:hypothetical protein